MSFPAIIDLGALTSEYGFQFNGLAASAFFGWSAAGIGDYNNDGIDDFVVCARGAGGNAGAAYVFFGQSGGFPSDFDLTDLDGTNGFTVEGLSGYFLGWSVAGGGDVNGDGRPDLIISGIGGQPNGTFSGYNYVLFGGSVPTGASFTLDDFDGTNGFRLVGPEAQSFGGWAVELAGDFNGDGIDDLVVTAYASDIAGGNAGAAYVVYGRGSGFPADINLADLNGSTGFRIVGEVANDNLGFDVSLAGDVNGDGYDDLLIGAPGPNSTFLLFGTGAAMPASISTASINGTNGFEFGGGASFDRLGSSVSAAGDVNGDGYDDLFVGAYASDLNASGAGDSYVVFGKAGGFTASLAIGDLNGTNGFRIGGVAANDSSGRELAYAGDINGDGYSDLVLGASRADPNGSESGTVYVIFGKAGGYTAVLNLASLDGTNGFRLSGAAAGDRAGLALAGVGDINGDGLDDFLIGSPYADTYGSNAGASYIIWGQSEVRNFFGKGGADNFNGGALDDIIIGAGGADILRGMGGADEISGGEADDQLYGGDGDDTLQGNAGADQLLGGDDNDILSGGADNDVLDGGAGTDTLQGGAGDDTYLVDGTDTIVEALNEGNDIVRSTVSWTLGDNFERLFLLGSADLDGTGNALANTLIGNSGQNRLDGGAGADILHGDSGIDTLVGGTGNDILSGGSGADTFAIGQASVFRSSDPQGRSIETDTISDFSTAGGDTLDLAAIDAIAGTGGDDAFTLVSVFDGQAGQMTLSFAGGITTLLLDVDGDRAADYRLRLNGDVTGDSGGWAL